MKKFDSILNQNKEIEDFKVFDVDSEWNSFLVKVGEPKQQSTTVESDNKPTLSMAFKKSKILIILIAASITLVLFFLFMFSSPQPKRQTIITSSDSEKINMVDGSKITLNQNSKVEYPISLDDLTKRKVVLVGSATFDVSRNEKLPFEVYYGDVLVEVLGTVFTIGKKDGLTVVQNIAGSIAVYQVLNRENKRILNQGETLLFQHGKFFVPEDTTQIIIDDRKIEVGVIEDAKPIKKKENESPKPIEQTESKGSAFKLDNVVKNYLIKFNKKKLKLEKGTKFDKNTVVKLDINKPYQEILQDLKNQGHINFKPGDCSDCFIITSPVKQQ